MLYRKKSSEFSTSNVPYSVYKLYRGERQANVSSDAQSKPKIRNKEKKKKKKSPIGLALPWIRSPNAVI